MFCRQAPSALLLAALALAGCGGSSHSSATSTSSATSATSASGTSSSGSATHSASAGSGGAGRSSGASSAAPGPSGGGSGGGGAINARVPATYHLAAGGHLTPATISAPAFIAVEVTIASSDSHPHTVQVRTPVPHTLHLPPRGRAAVRIPGLRAGTYPVAVDGAARGTLSIGGEPGP